MELTLEERLQLVIDDRLQWLHENVGQEARLALDRRMHLSKTFARMIMVELEQQNASRAKRGKQVVS